MNQSVLRINQVSERLGVSRSTIWNWGAPKSRHHRPDFPRPFKVSANVVGWLSSEIDDYIGKLHRVRRIRKRFATPEQAREWTKTYDLSRAQQP